MTNTPHPLRARVAAEVRAELARQGKVPADVGEVLGLSRPTVTNRLRGDSPFDLDELETLAAWLGVTPETFIPRREVAA